MNQTLILQPVVALFLLTVLVWVFMYARRLSFTWPTTSIRRALPRRIN